MTLWRPRANPVVGQILRLADKLLRNRKVRLVRPGYALALLISLVASRAGAESLFDAIALSYQTSPALLAARADQRAQDEKYIQARAGLGPTANVSAQHAAVSANVDQPASFFSPASRIDQHAVNDSAQLTLNQPLYSRGQLSSAISVARAAILSGRQQLRQEEAVLLNQVISDYADVLLGRTVLRIALDNIQTLEAQVTETQVKVEAKALTQTDGAQATSRLIAARVQLNQARKSLSDAETKYRSAVGQAPGQLDPLPDLPGIPPSLEAALDAAERANPQLLTALYTELGSRAGVRQAKAADGVQVGLSASLAQEPQEPYLPHQNARSFTASLVVSTPLFTAGAHQSQVRAALETNNRDSLRLADARRQIQALVIQAWDDLVQQRRLLETLTEQLEQETKAFNGERYEEHYGLRSTIELLNAEQELQSTRVALAQAYHDEYLIRVSLLAGIGVLQAELIDPEISPYRPEKSLAARNGMTRLLPWEGLVEAIDAVGAPRELSGAPDRDPLGLQKAASAEAMPPAPKWPALGNELSLGNSGISNGALK